MKLSDFLNTLHGVAPMDDGYIAECPAHADSHPSLRIGVSDSKVLLKCRAGCRTEDVLDAVNVSMRTLATMKIDDAAPSRRATSTDAPASPAAIAALATELDSYAARLRRGLEADDEIALAAQRYAEERFGLSGDDGHRLRLGVQDDHGTPRLVVPFLDERGIARGYQARALDHDAPVRWKGPHSPEDGGSWAKVGFMAGSAGWAEIIITEGPGDALTAVSLGYDAIAIRGAALAKNDAVIKSLVSMIGSRKAVIAGDGDTSGWDFSAALSRALLDHDVAAAVLDVPDGEDLTSWRQSASGEAIVRAVNDARVAVTTAAYGRELDDSRYPLNDTGAARWLRDYIRRHDSDVRYTPEAGFYLLHMGVWERDELDRTRAWAQDAFEDMAQRARAYLDAATAEDNDEAEARAKARLQHAHRYLNATPMDSALKQLRALRDVATRLGDFDQNPYILAAKNGVVDLRTGKLLPHSGGHMLTQRIDYNFDPAAKAPRWARFLDEVFPAHPELPDYLQRLIGYGITGFTSEQCFAIFWGSGANGKSVFTDTLTQVFRGCTVTTSFATFERRPSGGIPNDLAALKGARLVMASEGEADVPMAEAVLKRVTGHDMISARFMRQEFFEFRPAFLLMLATNNKPRFRGQDEGLWRRVKLIPWARYFEPHERDHKLHDKLMSEAEGIFAWAVRGATEWLAAGDLGDPRDIVEATEAYRQNSNTLDGFFPGVVESGDDADFVQGSTLYEEYLAWADEEHLSQRETWTRRTFYQAMEERGARKVRRKAGMGFTGIKHSDPKKAAAARAAVEPLADLPTASEKPSGSHRVGGASLDDLA